MRFQVYVGLVRINSFDLLFCFFQIVLIGKKRSERLAVHLTLIYNEISCAQRWIFTNLLQNRRPADILQNVIQKCMCTVNIIPRSKLRSRGKFQLATLLGPIK